MAEATTPPNPADEGGSRPVPDPTVLTTDALRREIAGLEKLIVTMLESIQRQLDEADKQRLEQKADTKAAVDAALAAQEKAIAKTEASTDTQIAQLNRTVDTKVEALQSSHNDLKERVTILEAVKQGNQEQRTETRAITAGQFTAAGVALVLLNIIIGIILYVASQPM